MALILQLPPDLEESLSEQARVRGISLEQYIQSLLEQLNPRPKRRLTMEEFRAALDGLAEYSHKIPDLPDEAFTREGIYRDHD